MQKNTHGQLLDIKVQKNVSLSKNVTMNGLFNSVRFFNV